MEKVCGDYIITIIFIRSRFFILLADITLSLYWLCTSMTKGKEIEWERLRDLLRLAQKARRNYDPSDDNSFDDDKTEVSRQTIDLFFRFLTSKTGLFLKEPLVNELSEIVDSMASVGEANLLRFSNGLIRPLPGGNGPVNSKRMEELSSFLDTLQNALSVNGNAQDMDTSKRLSSLFSLLNEVLGILSDERHREESRPLRGSYAMRYILNLSPATVFS